MRALYGPGVQDATLEGSCLAAHTLGRREISGLRLFGMGLSSMDSHQQMIAPGYWFGSLRKQSC